MVGNYTPYYDARVRLKPVIGESLSVHTGDWFETPCGLDLSLVTRTVLISYKPLRPKNCSAMLNLSFTFTLYQEDETSTRSHRPALGSVCS